MKHRDYLQELLDSVKETSKNENIDCLSLHDADRRCGKKVALVIKGQGISPQTNYLIYREMEAFLQGMLFLQRRLKIK